MSTLTAYRFDNMFDSFFNRAGEGIIIFNSTGEIIYVNNAARELFDYKERMLNQKKIDELIDSKYHTALWEICNALLQGTKRNKYRNTLIIPDQVKNGKQTALGLYFNNYIKSEEGQLITAVVIDETQRWKDKHELRQSHERFKKVFHNSPMAQIIVRATDSLIVDTNQKFLKLFGYNREEVIDRSIESIGLNHCNDCGTEIMRSVDQKSSIHDCEATVYKKNGDQISILQSLVMIKIHDSPHILWTVIDITERIDAVTRLRQMNEELESKVQERTRELTNMLTREKSMNDLKSRFVSMASHEFRTPLTTVLSNACLLETRIKLNGNDNCTKCTKHIARIKLSVKVLAEILEEFLSLDKIEQGQVKSHITFFDLNEFADNILNETEAILKKGQSIVHTLNGNQQIKQDISILRNIMLNLLSNASKYSGEGNIKWVTSVKKDKIIISVADSGIGIPADDQPYIFSRFFRAKNAEVIQGTGLGLNIIKKYVELLNGKISFASVENVGTTFIMELPIMK